MIRWCCYCQTFIGEKEPLSNYSVTHSICTSCNSNLLNTDHKNINTTKLIKPIKDFFASVFHMAETLEYSDPQELIKQGLKLGIKKSDLLLGIIKPALWKVGQQYGKGKLTVYQEHDFTRYCNAIIHEIGREYQFKPLDLNKGTLFVCIDSNFHTLGVQILEIIARENGIAAKAVYPSIPNNEIIDLVKLTGVSLLCVSISSSQQIPTLLSLQKELYKLDKPPVLAAGGLSTDQLKKLDGILSIDQNSFLDLLNFLKENNS